MGQRTDILFGTDLPWDSALTFCLGQVYNGTTHRHSVWHRFTMGQRTDILFGTDLPWDSSDILFGTDLPWDSTLTFCLGQVYHGQRTEILFGTDLPWDSTLTCDWQP